VAVWRAFSNPGRVVVIEREPLLEAFATTNNQPVMVLYGLPDHPHLMSASPGLPPVNGWLPAWQGTMPSNSIWMMVDGITNSIAPTLFLRAEDLFGP
jgi:hypothetical protein